MQLRSGKPARARSGRRVARWPSFSCVVPRQPNREASARQDLARAHELHPGSFPIAKAYVERLLQSGEHPEARKVLQDVIEAYAAPGDRRAAHQMLTSRPLSPALPKDE